MSEYYELSVDPDCYHYPFREARRQIRRFREDADILPKHCREEIQYAEWLEASFCRFLDKLDAALASRIFDSLPFNKEVTSSGKIIILYQIAAGPFLGEYVLRRTDKAVHGVRFFWDVNIKP